MFPSRGGYFFNSRVIGGGVQNVVVAQIHGNVPDAVDARQVLTAFVGEIDTIPAFQIRARNEFALYDLRARRHVKQFPRTVIEHILHE